MTRTALIMVLVAVLAASGGYWLAGTLGTAQSLDNQTDGAPEAVFPEDLLGQARPDFSHTTLEGGKFSAENLDGAIWLVNFWATWCKPCVEEMPMLSNLHDSGQGAGVNVVGVALDDAERARRFVQELGISYPVLVGGADVVLTGRRYGNASGMLPYSVLVDASGVVRWAKLGALDREELLQQIEKLN